MATTSLASESSTFLGVEVGTWPAWGSVVVASIAALVAWSSYSRTQREKREAQARLVWVSLKDVVFPEGANQLMPAHGGDDELLYIEQSVTLHRWSHGQLGFRTPGGFRLPIVLHNGSKELVLRWRYDVFDAHDGALRFASTAQNPLPPESEIVIAHIGVAYGRQLKEHFDVAVTFQDGSSRVWTRPHLGPIRRVPL